MNKQRQASSRERHARSCTSPGNPWFFCGFRQSAECGGVSGACCLFNNRIIILSLSTVNSNTKKPRPFAGLAGGGGRRTARSRYGSGYSSGLFGLPSEERPGRRRPKKMKQPALRRAASFLAEGPCADALNDVQAARLPQGSSERRITPRPALCNPGPPPPRGALHPRRERRA